MYQDKKEGYECPAIRVFEMEAETHLLNGSREDYAPGGTIWNGKQAKSYYDENEKENEKEF